MIETTLTDVERLGAFDDAERTFQMTEEVFRVFYEQTARQVWLYLARVTGDRRLADDLLQETFYRFLRARASFDSDDHRRHYLFRIATNLVHDHRRRPRVDSASLSGSDDTTPSPSAADPAERAARQIDLSRAMAQLKPRERSLLWLAYAQGCSHEEIAAVVGVKKASMKALLHRARRRLLALLTAPPSGGRR
jgi:RNA polymerase sigma-70 factor, ECF subfamily